MRGEFIVFFIIKLIKNYKPLFTTEDNSNTSNKDTFETLQVRKSKWTPQGANSHL